MFARKKSGMILDPDQDFGSVNTARTFNVRRQGPWPGSILYNVKSDEGPTDRDEYDKQQQSFFDCVGPESIGGILLGSTEVLPPNRPLEKMKLVEDYKLDIFEFDEILNDSPLRRGKHHSTIDQQKLDNLSEFMKKIGIVEKNTLEIEEKNSDDFIIDNFMDDDLKETYLKVGTQENRKKTAFTLRPNESAIISDLIDSLVSGKSTKTVKSKPKNSQDKRRNQSNSLSHSHLSSDDVSLPSKKAEPNLKKVSPAESSKRAPNGKNTRKTEEVKEAPKAANSAFEIFVPKKEPKLRTANLNDFLRSSDAVQQKERLARMQRERKEKEDELKIINEKKNKKGDEIEATKFKIPKKVGATAPLPVKKSPDPSEPTKKKVRLNPPNMQSVDILGTITEAMDAHSATSGTRLDKDEETILPRVNEDPLPPPSLPRRFGMQDDDHRDEMMDISNSSPDASPRSNGERIMPPFSRDIEGMKGTGDVMLDEGSIVDRSDEIIARAEAALNMDKELGDLYLTEALADNVSTEALADNLSAEALPVKVDTPESKDNYRFIEVDNIPPFIVRVETDTSETASFVGNSPSKVIPLIKKELGTDPRLPGPSPGTLSRWANTRVEIHLDQEDTPIPVVPKDTGVIVVKEKKGVKWGETATKEFDPNDDAFGRPTEMDKKSTEAMETVVGEKEVGGKKYKIVKKVIPEKEKPIPPKSCLKPYLPPAPMESAFIRRDLYSSIRRPVTPPTGYSEDGFSFNHNNVTSSIGRVPTLPDFVPPPGYGREEREKKEKEEREKKEKREKEEREKREKEAKEKKEREEKQKRDREARERREEEERRKWEMSTRNSSSPEVVEVISPKMRNTPTYGSDVRVNQGASSSNSMGNLNTFPSMAPTYGGSTASSSLNDMRGTATASRSYEKGSEIVGERAPMELYDEKDVKYQLEMRARLVRHLSAHRTMSDDPEKEYPVDMDHPSTLEQTKEQDNLDYELTRQEIVWKKSGVQPVWLQSLPVKAQFSFESDAGLYWPVVQATDRIDENEPDFQSMDVLRSLGNNTHFATEKKALLGLESRLPNGMSHKERFEAFMNGENGEKPEGRFKNRPMHSRVFSTQSEEDARAIHNERLEEERRLLEEHEETMKTNAPEGVRIKKCEMTIDRPAGFRDFPSMIQYYKRDQYETDTPYEDRDWYCNDIAFYMPYTERVNYLCHVINHFNSAYNALYEDSGSNKTETMITLDKAAFAASQIDLERMEGWKRVGVSEAEYTQLLKRHNERMDLMEKPSFALETYKELSALTTVEQPFFHFIIDWLSSNFKIIKPISEWSLGYSLDSAFREIILLSDKKDEEGHPRDAREVFYEAFHAAKPSAAKKSRSSSSNTRNRF